MKQILISLIIIAIIVIGLYFWIFNSSNNIPIAAADLSWSYQDGPINDTTQASTTEVTLTVKGKTYDAGTYDGTCKELGPDDLLTNEIGAVSCYFAGSGDEIGVFNESGQMYLEQGQLQEPSEEDPAVRGNFKKLIPLTQ
jgi:hypothetical protein